MKKFVSSFLTLAIMVSIVLSFSTMAFAAGSTLELGNFDVNTGTFKDVTGSGSDTYGCVAIYMGDLVSSGDSVTLPSGYSESPLSDAYKIYIPLSSAMTASEIATDLISNIVFDFKGEQDIRIELLTSVPTTNYFYFAETDHYYTFVDDTSKNWPDAYEASRSLTYNDWQGYLATVTSIEEDEFVYEASGHKVGWMGGTRLSLEDKDGQYYDTIGASTELDHWEWACGPEIGVVFFDTIKVPDSRSTDPNDTALRAEIFRRNDEDNHYYFNWDVGEPSNSNDKENCLTTLMMGNGYSTDIQEYSWNDIPYNGIGIGAYSPRGYLVEFGNLPTGDSHEPTNIFADGHIILPVAQVENSKYETVEAATKDVTDNGTITLLSDTENEKITISEAITFSIDANGYTNNVTIEAGTGYRITPTENGDITTYAVEKIPEVTISFNMNGHGSQVDPQTTYEGDVAVEPANPSADGWTFDGWYADEQLTSEFDFSTAITENTTIYAKWTENAPTPANYTVTFEMGGHGTQVNPQTVKEGSTATEPTAPSEEGYSFDGWYTDSGFTSKFDFGSAITADTTLYAKWTCEISYAFENDDVLTWQLGGTINLNYVIHRNIDDSKTFSLFEEVKIDGKTVSADNYIAVSGSLNLGLKSGYLNTLSAGEHTLEVVFEDGTVSIKFNIKAVDPSPTPASPTPTSPTPTTNPQGNLPQTGEAKSWTAICGILLIAGSVVLVIEAARKRREF